MTMISKEIKTSTAKIRKEKRKKPEFRRQESWRYKKLKEKWRRPRGLDNKIRRKIKGWQSSPNSGYQGLKKSRNLHPSGFKEVRVFNTDDLQRIEPNHEAARIGRRVGARKRIEIVKRAKELGIYILNPRQFRELEESVNEKGEP